MQWQGNAAVAAMAGSVRGLGVCDALRVELEAEQWAGLAAHLDARMAALASGPVDTAAGRGERRVMLARIRAQLPAGGGTAFALVAPAGLALELVDACLNEAVGALARRLADRPASAWSPALATDAAAAGAWISTALDCRAVEGFCFDTGADPGHAW